MSVSTSQTAEHLRSNRITRPISTGNKEDKVSKKKASLDVIQLLGKGLRLAEGESLCL